MTRLSKRELWREVERLKEAQQSQSLDDPLRESTDKDGGNDEETLEELAETVEELF